MFSPYPPFNVEPSLNYGKPTPNNHTIFVAHSLVKARLHNRPYRICLFVCLFVFIKLDTAIPHKCQICLVDFNYLFGFSGIWGVPWVLFGFCSDHFGGSKHVGKPVLLTTRDTPLQGLRPPNILAFLWASPHGRPVLNLSDRDLCRT